jgi:hypothetical protein
MSEATPRRVRLAEAREARIHRPEAAAAYEQARLRYELAEAIRARREELGWSQRQLAERAGTWWHHSHSSVAGTPRQRARADGDHQPRSRGAQVCLTQQAGFLSEL